jgi:CRISPR-associated protein Csd2
MSEQITNRYEFVLFFDVENGNPNGDPDAGNMPRIDPQTGYGIVSDVCLKRKVRNYVDFKMQRANGYDIYVTEGAILNDKHKKACEVLTAAGKIKKTDKGYTKDDREVGRKYMCDHFFDVRTFGAVMDTGEKSDFKCGQVRGPVQICFSRSQSKIFQQEIPITRIAVANEKEQKENEEKSKDGTKDRTMGRKYIVPYGLYRAEGFVSANFAAQTGFSEDDLNLFFDALVNMFDQDRSASHGKMTARKLFVFKHKDKLGNAPANILFEKIEVKLLDETRPPRAFADYCITVKEDMPDGVTFVEKL